MNTTPERDRVTHEDVLIEVTADRYGYNGRAIHHRSGITATASGKSARETMRAVTGLLNEELERHHGSDRTPDPDVPVPGVYRHFKGGRYEVLGTARHTGTDETVVMYRALGGAQWWVRPLSQWMERVVDGDGHGWPRFAREPG